MSKITKIIARQIFDSRGNPTIEVEVFSRQPKFSGIHNLVDDEFMVDKTSLELLKDLFAKFLHF